MAIRVNCWFAHYYFYSILILDNKRVKIILPFQKIWCLNNYIGPSFEGIYFHHTALYISKTLSKHFPATAHGR